MKSSLFIALIVFIICNACSKGEQEDTSLNLTYRVDSLAHKIYYFYGDDSKVNSVAIQSLSSSDTTVYMFFDDQSRVKNVYTKVNGDLEKTLINLSYEDTLIVTSLYSINWKSGESHLDLVSTMTQNQLNAMVSDLSRDSPMNLSLKNANSYICNSISSIIVTTAILGYIGTLFSSTICLPCAIVAGLTVGIVCVPPSNASDQPPRNYPPDPIAEFNKTFPDVSSSIIGGWALHVWGNIDICLEFEKNGVLTGCNNTTGEYTMMGTCIKFSYTLNSIAVNIYPGQNYYIGNLSDDGNSITGKIYDLKYKRIGTFFAERF